MVFGTVGYAVPGSDLNKATKNTWTWDGIVRSVSLFAAGSFSDRLNYYVKASLSPGSFKLGAAYLVWSDLIGPRHLLNLSIGRLGVPQLTSYFAGESYVSYQFLPSVSVAGLFNPSSSFVLGAGPVDGAEANGVAFHRISYSAGWIASNTQTGLSVPTSEDVYMHVGAKFGGMSLDGEGPRGMETVDPVKPWAETSVTFDTFGYRGVTLADNGINAPQVTPQRSQVVAAGHAVHVNLRSFLMNGMLQYQVYHRPYPGTAPTTLPNHVNALPGVPDNHKGRGIIASGEMAYVIYPWLIPAIRVEYTRLDSDWGVGSLLRVLPGATFLIRPNLRLFVVADFERATKLPPAAPGTDSWWTLAGGSVQPAVGQASKFQVEQISAVASWAF
jgi:hypothetical protein